MSLAFALVALLSSAATGHPTEAAPLTAPFHRLLIYNEAGEVLVARAGPRDWWVTPGFYQADNVTFESGLREFAKTYQLALDPPSLRGVFSLLRVSGPDTTSHLRLVYTTRTAEALPAVPPPGVNELRWVPVDSAYALISLPHITSQLRQIHEHPNDVWGGTLLQNLNDPETADTSTDVAFVSLGSCR